MAINFSNDAPALLLINNYPLVFGTGYELVSASEMTVGKAEDQKAFNWGFNNFFTDPSAKGHTYSGTQEKYQGQNLNLDGISHKKGLSSVYIRPVFSGLELEIKISSKEYALIYPILKPLINYVYRQGVSAKQFTSFYSPVEYIVDAYIESSSVKREAKQEHFTWLLSLKAKQNILDNLDQKITKPKAKQTNQKIVTSINKLPG